MKIAFLNLLLFTSMAFAQTRELLPRVLVTNSLASGGGISTVIEFAGDNASEKITVSVPSGAGNTWSISGWMRPVSASDSYGCVMTLGSGNFGMFFGSDQKFNFYNGTDHKSTGTASYGNWHHFTYAVDAVGAQLYIDSVPDMTNNHGGTFAFQGFDTFGTDSSNEEFKGRLCQIALYSETLSATDATNLWTKVKTPDTLGKTLIGYWKLNDVADGVNGSGATFADSSGNGYNGTGAGGTGPTGRTDDH